MKNLFVPAFLFIAMHVCGQTTTYDSTLAKKLHADKNGMKKYIMAILKTAPGDTVKGPRRDSLFAGHFRNIGRLADQGLLSVAGPIGKNSMSYRGVFIFNVDNIEEAKKLCETDPSIKAGIFSAELFEWYASAALQETTKIHRTIQRK